MSLYCVCLAQQLYNNICCHSDQLHVHTQKVCCAHDLFLHTGTRPVCKGGGVKIYIVYHLL